MNDKSLFFITLSLCCIWVILDNIFGNKYLDTFLSNVFDFYGTKKLEDKHENHEEAVKDWASNLDGNPDNALTDEEKKKQDIMIDAPKFQW